MAPHAAANHPAKAGSAMGRLLEAAECADSRLMGIGGSRKWPSVTVSLRTGQIRATMMIQILGIEHGDLEWVAQAAGPDGKS